MEDVYALAKKLNMDDTALVNFKNATFVGTPVFHKVHNLLEMEIEFDHLLPYSNYDVFTSKLIRYVKCRISCKMKIRDNEYAVGEINKYIKRIVEKEGTYRIFLKTFPLYENGVLIYQYASNEEKHEAKMKREMLKEQLAFYGIDVDIDIDDVEFNNEIKSVQVNLVKEEKKPVQVKEFKKNNNYKKTAFNDYQMIQIKEATEGISDVKIQGKIFEKENQEMRNGKIRQNLYIHDDSESMIVQRFERGNLTKEILNEVNVGDYVMAYGSVEYNPYMRELVFKPTLIEKCKETYREDTAEEKRVELHVHTKYSEMDGVCEIGDFVKQAAKWGHNAIAITDHVGVQAFPFAQEAVAKINKGEREKPFKMLYGVEMNMVDPYLEIVKNIQDIELEKGRYCIFDLETTGLSSKYDHIIEFGGQIVENRSIIKDFQLFVKPPVQLAAFTTELTGITENDLAGAQPIEECIDQILDFIGDRILIAHNAKFDVSFLNDVLIRMGRKPLNNPVIDTLDLDYSLHADRKAHRLGNIARLYGVRYDEEGAHRADYDAKVLAEVYLHMLNDIRDKHPEVKTLQDLQNMQDVSCFSKVRKKHVVVMAKNAAGLKELFELITLSHINYLAETSAKIYEPRIPRFEIEKRRKNGNLIIGSSCQNSDVFEIAHTRGDRNLQEVMKFYDYIEIQPPEVYSNLIYRNTIADEERLEEILKNIIRVGKNLGKIVVASGDCHYVDPSQKQIRDIYINAQGVGGVRHPLYIFKEEKRRMTPAPNQHFRTTNEMLDDFAFLGKDLAKEIVVTNTNKIADMVEPIYPVKDRLYPPFLDKSAENLTNLCYETAHKIYGDNLPEIVEKRLKRELDSIIGNGYEVVYYISHLLVKKSNSDGYLVGSRGSVGSSFVATMSGITEVNPLVPHYICPKCHYVHFFEDGSVASGFDLPDANCPKCGAPMNVNGQDIPFETFLGFEGDKVPDIDLNFSGDYQPTAHAFTKEVFDEDHVFRAGTIATVADKTAYGYVKGYCEEMGIEHMSNAQMTYLSREAAGVKRSTGQHPGGIIVVPMDMSVHDFTPVQYPANDPTSEWKTTHFDFHRIHDNVLKFDILGHVDPTAMRFLENVSGLDVKNIPMNDKATMSIFSCVDALEIDTSKNTEKTGAVGIPEFGTPFVRGILELTKPTTFDELVKISGLSHGTDVWLNNAKDLIDAGVCNLKEVIGCRDDIMVYLMHKGVAPKLSFTIMESVRKGRGLKDEWIPEMKKNGVEDWYIDSCKKIKYMFPKAHAVAYVMMAIRIAWFKVHKPIYYYSMFFSLRCDAYDIESMIGGEAKIRERMSLIQNRMNNPDTKRDVTKKEHDIYSTLEVALEMVLRGYRFSNIDLEKSDAIYFLPDKDNPTHIVPPFACIDGLGENVARTVIEARKQAPFLSKEDLLKRTSLSGTHMKDLDRLGVLGKMQEENQMSLF